MNMEEPITGYNREPPGTETPHSKDAVCDENQAHAHCRSLYEAK